MREIAIRKSAIKVDAAKIRARAGCRLIKHIGALEQKDLDASDNAIKIRLGLFPVDSDAYFL